jgi:AraC-like DNA-binding protein/transcriptional regulator with XRE-family HTH domain
MLVHARRAAGGKRGLTQEQVADRSGVGLTWYRWLEEGRNIGLSNTSLGWVAGALNIRGHERRTLFELAGIEEAIELAPFVEPTSPSVKQMVDAFAAFPAYVTGRRGDVLAWNELTEAVYRCHVIPPLKRNSYLFVFAQPEVRKLIVNWEDQARRQVRDLKLALEQAPQDPVLSDLRRHLEAVSPDFGALWRAKPKTESGLKIFSHPRVGRLVFDLQYLLIENEPGLCMRVYVPHRRDGTRTRMARLIRLHRSDEGSAQRRALQTAMRRAKEHLDACYARDVPLDEMAALVDMGRYRLLRAFANEVGYPPHAYQLLIRVGHARRLLSAGVEAADVAQAVGFADQSHLIRHFRRLEGMTPAEYVRRSNS